MADWLESVRMWIEQMTLMLGYPGIALVMFAENVFPPIPSEIVMPFAGYLAVRDELNFAGALAAGALLGAGAWLGSRWGQVLSFIKRYEQGVWLALAVIGLGFVLLRLNTFRRARETGGDPP
jgi:membrane protein DedA with SNARE-associated domain